MREYIGTAQGGKKQNASRKLLVKIRKDIGAWMLMLPCLACFVLFVWRPVLSGIYLSFFKTKGFDSQGFIGLENYFEVIRDYTFLKAAVNSVLYTVWSIILGLVLPIALAILLNEMEYFKGFFRFAFYFPSMVPAVAASLLWLILLDPSQGGFFNMIFGIFGIAPSGWLQNPNLTIPMIIVTIVWRGFGSGVLIYLASLQGVNQELYEATSIDGAGIWNRIKNITIPQISGIISIMVVLQIISVFQIFYEPLTMTDGGPNFASVSLMLLSYNYAFNAFKVGQSMALGNIVFILLMIITVVYFKLEKKMALE